MIPDYFEPITAYRCFDVYPNGLLVGQAYAEPWPPYTPFVGRCGFVTPRGHEAHLDAEGVFQPAPIFACDCGVHALKSEADMIARRDLDWERYRHQYGSYDRHYRPGFRAWGPVKLWGRVIEHEIGYRAQYAYPASLTCDNEQVATLVAKVYGVPCGFKAGPEKLPDQPFGFDWYAAPTFVTRAPNLVLPPLLHPAPMPAPLRVVGATPHQIRQYGKTNVPIVVAQDWRDILKEMVFLNAKTKRTVKKLDILYGHAALQPSAGSLGVLKTGGA